jgi:hypothetical protein
VESILYIPFKAIADLQKQLTAEIEARCDKGEYVSLLKDCYYAYFAARKKLLLPIATAEVDKIANSTTDIITMVHLSLSYTR